MPKRKTNQNKKRKNKKGQKATKGGYNDNNNNNNNNNNDANIDFDALIEQQINASASNNQSHSSISQMLQSKIAEIEQSQKRQENAALFKKNVILQQMTMMKQQYENNKSSDTENASFHLDELYKFITRINDIFYDVLESESKLKNGSSNIIQQNETLKKLCKKLQEDKKILNKNIEEIENREKNWRNEIEGKFQNSLQDIKMKIGDHEKRYNAVVDENKKLREQLQTFLDYDKKRSSDFELYKEHQGKLDEIHDKEKENFTQLIEKEKQQTLKLSNNLKQAIEINDLLKQRCNQYEAKFVELGKTVKESSKCIDEYKKMNTELMKQNKSLHQKLNDIMSKYKQLNSYNDQLDVKNIKSAKRIDTLSELCRKLQLKNKDLNDDLKMAKTSLFNQGISLQFKSDIKPKKNSKKMMIQTKNTTDDDDDDGDIMRNEEDDNVEIETNGNINKNTINEPQNDANTVDSKIEEEQEEQQKEKEKKQETDEIDGDHNQNENKNEDEDENAMETDKMEQEANKIISNDDDINDKEKEIENEQNVDNTEVTEQTITEQEVDTNVNGTDPAASNEQAATF